MTEREKQAGTEGACSWVVYPSSYFKDACLPVECRAATERGAFRVAEAEHPGIPFVSATPGYLRK